MRPNRFRLACVMGWPIAQSRSPKIHNFWLAQHGLEGCYVPIEVEPDKIEAALRALAPLGFSGCNLTVPHKQRAMAVMDHVDPLARRVGAVNCVVVGADGSLTGRNHDVYGFMAALRAGAPNWLAADAPCVLLGAGGAARAILCGLLDAGAREIRIFNRSPEAAQILAAEFGPFVAAFPWAERSAGLAGAGLLVNATSLGMTGKPPLEIALDAQPADAVVCDIVYAPLETPLLAAARRRGAVAVDGLGMLLHQAAPAFSDWFGVMPQVTPDLRALIEATL